MAVQAVLWDFGGVLADSPFDAFARYERRNGLPEGFLRSINARDADTNAWACFERGEIDLETFADRFEHEALGAGSRVDAREVIALVDGDIRPVMIEAVRRCRTHVRTALLTNNVSAMDKPIGEESLSDLFDVIIESSRVGVRKPDPRFYQLALDALGVEAADAVFLDDLGVNLKPARQLGMTTIKVTDPDVALAELEAAVGFSLR
jgi:putative hydrolase of the HAD superfamily